MSKVLAMFGESSPTDLPGGGPAGQGLDDPYELLHKLTSARTIRDPHTSLEALRRLAPIVERFPDGSMGVPRPPTEPRNTKAPRFFVAVSHRAVTEILKNARVFSSRMFSLNLWLALGHSVQFMDEPQHGD